MTPTPQGEMTLDPYHPFLSGIVPSLSIEFFFQRRSSRTVVALMGYLGPWKISASFV